ncbi:DUF397 domain-containing protein [Amycolatopsis sp. NPDC059027]|uniref:DUF397 domain-containing protein n=1 Tax=unclassified Amycolatopsis TaxID=2618356 RepID=UPI003671C644
MFAPDFAGLHWRKSSYSNGHGECVEVAGLPGDGMAVRDSKLGDRSPVLAVDASGWNGLLTVVKTEDF